MLVEEDLIKAAGGQVHYDLLFTPDTDTDPVEKTRQLDAMIEEGNAAIQSALGVHAGSFDAVPRANKLPVVLSAARIAVYSKRSLMSNGALSEDAAAQKDREMARLTEIAAGIQWPGTADAPAKDIPSPDFVARPKDDSTLTDHAKIRNIFA